MKNRPTIHFSFTGFAILLSFSFVAVILSGFERPQNPGLKEFRIPTIVGNPDTTTLCLSPAYMLNAWYNIDRMDSITDTLNLSRPSKEEEDLSYQFFMPEHLSKLPVSNAGLCIIADTINELSMTKRPIWASYLFNREYTDSIHVLQDDTLIQQVKSFPIYVANLSDSDFGTLTVQDGSMMLIVQAIDREGDWKPIEYWSGSWCGNSYYTMMIPPRHMMMTRGIKCSGDFRTKCRLELTNDDSKVYSNEFFMSINETQFEMPVKKGRK